jgi:succinyl-diaminopimelate desuccinylase
MVLVSVMPAAWRRRAAPSITAQVRSACVATDSELGERLAARTLELVDVASESRHEAELAARVREVLRAGGVSVRDLGDDCILAEPAAFRPAVLLAGHLDTVPPQDNLPGRRDGERVHGLGTSDMKGALAVMTEALLAGLPYAALYFPREELPATDSALAPLLARERPPADLVVVMEPTDNELHAGCVGNINATWTFHGRSGHSARPWLASNAIHHAALGVAHLAASGPVPVTFAGLTFHEVASVTRIAGGIAANVVPDLCTCQINFRYAPGRSPHEAESRLHELTAGFGELRIDANAGSAPVALDNEHARRLIAAGDLAVAPKQAWTPVAEFAAAGYSAVNFGPGAPAQAHRRDEHVEIAALVRSYRVLEALAA